MAQGREGMEMKFTYAVDEVLAKLKENRKKHEADYKKAMQGYHAERKEVLMNAVLQFDENKAKLFNAQEDGEDYDLHDLMKDVKLHLDKPVEYLEQYDDFIEQLTMTAQDEFELSRTMFKQLVQDDWEWTRNFKMSNSKYLG
jgi:hypothetical protein